MITIDYILRYAVRELAGWVSVGTEVQWGMRRAQALSNLPQLADALAHLENPARFSVR